MLAGIFLTAVATGLYISAGFEPGPRDGLMTGLVKRTGFPVRRIRTGIELTVLTIGFLLGGAIGAGTVVFAVTIGPLSQHFLRRFGWRAPGPPAHRDGQPAGVR